MTKEQYLLAAKQLIEFESIALPITNSNPCIVMYRGKPHIGSTQILNKEYPDVVLVAHSSASVDNGLKDALIELSDRPIFKVDSGLILAHRQDVLRINGEMLVRLTPEQTVFFEEFLAKHPIIEI